MSRPARKTALAAATGGYPPPPPVACVRAGVHLDVAYYYVGKALHVLMGAGCKRKMRLQLHGSQGWHSTEARQGSPSGLPLPSSDIACGHQGLEMVQRAMQCSLSTRRRPLHVEPRRQGCTAGSRSQPQHTSAGAGAHPLVSQPRYWLN